MTPAAEAPDPDAYVESVLRLVEQVPAGQVTTYGDVAAAVGRAGPRQVGTVMARFGAAVAWWRVVRADGQPARGHEEQALRLLRAEHTPLLGTRVLLSEARCALVDLGSIRTAPDVNQNLAPGFTGKDNL